MPDFPSLKPATRTFAPGSYHQSGYLALNGKQSSVFHSNASTTSQLRLTYQAISADDRTAIESHYYGQRGPFAPFALPAETFTGTSGSFGALWRYSSAPQVEEIPGPYYNVTVSIESAVVPS